MTRSAQLESGSEETLPDSLTLASLFHLVLQDRIAITGQAFD